MRLIRVAHDGLDLGRRVGGAFQPFCELAKHLGHGRVEVGVGGGDGLGRTDHAELEFIAGESERTRTVTIGQVQGQAREARDAQLHAHAAARRAGLALHDGVQDLAEHAAEEDGDDGRRGLAGAQAVVVAGGGRRRAEEEGVAIDRLDHRGGEEQEARVLARVLAGVEEVHAVVGGHGPVVMLARAVHAGEGFLVEERLHAVPPRHLLDGLHDQLVAVGRHVGAGEDGRDLELVGRDLVVLGLGGDAYLPELVIELAHKEGDALLDGAEVVVLHLLALGRHGAEHGAPGEEQVRPLVEPGLVY